ncbi:hypothetical protein C2R22_14840 [Salinigranum rubrum]|uniref:Uncharacterized protein n=1 Tax=Salinigranum rubrum TaxID=755307 RepID=A0A2I8VLE5_9EURY|nr:hypothetical protein [Salinigranum rubrum]AUV82763.1 hypothetical protein C2R22_14840 [Salinigranum rubrum]
MAPETISRWARRYALVSVSFLLLWQLASVLGVPRRTEVTLAVYGFVFPMVFGKAYSLVPTYFDRTLAFPRAPAVGLPFVVVGAGGLAAGTLSGTPSWLASTGALAWAVGVAVFLGTLGWTVRHDPTGRATATGEHNADRRPVDRVANAFVPVAFAYLLVGTSATLGLHTGLPPLLDGYPPRVTHLLAAGAAGLLVFALGFRLLPRFFGAPLPRSLAVATLLPGALAPGLLATRLLDAGRWFRAGALLEAGAVCGFALAVALLARRSSRRRVGLSTVLVAAGFGVLGVAFGLWFAFEAPSAALVRAHLRVNLLGFLGLTVVGLAYQFYPPAVGDLPGSSDSTARVSVLALSGGLLAQVGGLTLRVPTATTLGEWLALCGALCYAYLLAAAFLAR